MNCLDFNGKQYEFPSLENEIALMNAGVLIFYYYPQDNIMAVGNMYAEHFGTRQLYTNMPYSYANEQIAPEDRFKMHEMERLLKKGEQKASCVLHSIGDHLSRVTITAVEYNEDKTVPLKCIGIVQEIEKEVLKEMDNNRKLNERLDKNSVKLSIAAALCQDFHTIWIVDKVTRKMSLFKKLDNETVDAVIEMFRNCNNLDEAFVAYAQKFVYADDREGFLEKCRCDLILKTIKSEKNFYVNFRRVDLNSNIENYRITFAPNPNDSNTFVLGFCHIPS